MSSLVDLFNTLAQSTAEELRVSPGDAVRLVANGDARSTGGRLDDRTIRKAASELLSQEELDELPTQRPRIVRHEHEGVLYVVEIARGSAGISLAIRPAKRPAGRSPAPAPEPPPAPAPAAPRARRSERVRAAAPPPPPANDRLELAVEPRRGAIAEAATSRAGDVERAARPTIKQEVRPTPVPRAPAPSPAASALVQDMGPKRIDELLRTMIATRASDLHLSAGSPPVMRVDGEIQFLRDRPVLASSDVEALVRAIMNDKAASAFAELHDADFAYEIPGLARFRVNVFEDRNGVGAVLRQIPVEILSAEKLGLPKACLDLCNLSKGLVVVTGPTGSGKSTTLAAMIDHINRTRSDHIITIEDPVEFVHPNQKCLVNQREVGHHTMSFKNALRAALREDPDIVLVGEMRDLETIAIAIETAETGHLVFGTLHTTTAVSTVDRIIDQFPTDRQAQIRVMLSESLKGVVAQVLCKKVGGGRVAAHEIMLGTNAVSALIRDGKTFQMASVMQTSKAHGMVTMNDSLFSLVQRKLVDPKEAWMKAVDKNGLLSMLKNAGVPTPFAS